MRSSLIERRLDESARVLWTTVQGDVTATDLRGHIEAVREIEGQRYCEVIDTRGATARFGARDLPKLARYAQTQLAGAPMAPRAVIVNRRDLVAFGLARLFASLAAPWVTVRVFDNLPAALAYVEAFVAHGA